MQEYYIRRYTARHYAGSVRIAVPFHMFRLLLLTRQSVFGLNHAVAVRGISLDNEIGLN